jgi:hypothetical protein
VPVTGWVWDCTGFVRSDPAIDLDLLYLFLRAFIVFPNALSCGPLKS